MPNKKLDVQKVEAKVKAAMRFIGKTEHSVWLCGHRYDFGPMKRSNNRVEYNAKTGQVKVFGHAGGGKRRVNRVIGNSKYRAEALRAVFNSLLPEVRCVGHRKMEQERLNSYLRSKKVPLSL